MAKKYEEYLAELGVGNGMPTAAEVGQQIMGREPFKYDVNTDELYKQYMDKYSALGKKAMEDTIGKSTALTGGYANSYAQVAGQQAYNDYMSKASDMIPELYQMAYNRYNAEGDNLRNNYAMLLNAENTAYDRAKADEQWEHDLEREKVSDERYAQEWAQQLENNAWERNFKERQFDEEKRQFGLNYNLSKNSGNKSTTPTTPTTNFSRTSFYDSLEKYKGNKIALKGLIDEAYADNNISDDEATQLGKYYGLVEEYEIGDVKLVNGVEWILTSGGWRVKDSVKGGARNQNNYLN